MSDESQLQPYKALGEKLRLLRQKRHESVADVSGAVEIDEQVLVKIEQGKVLPSEDILMLLINHFGMPDDDAASLWELAGYDLEHDPGCDGHCRDHDAHNQDDDDYESRNGRQEPQSRTLVTVMLLDPRVIYTDGAQVTANQHGVIIGFSQGSGTPHALTTAKVGMSREQAYSLMRTLQRTLEASEPKQLPDGTQDKADEKPAS